jgi:transcriptional regulator with XRE-family HTH domain
MQIPALAGNLRKQRSAAGLTQVALAKKSGVSLRTVQQVEGGEGTTVSTVYALASALGVPAGLLLDPSPTEAVS